MDYLKGHLIQYCKGGRSTKKKSQPISLDSLPDITSQLPSVQSKELHVWVEPISKIYTDNMGRFPVCSRSSNRYIMRAYHVNTNAILVSAFQSCNDQHCMAAYNSIMSSLKSKGRSVDIQVLDNEASSKYCCTIDDGCNCTFQLVPPDLHRRNIAERAIRNFKAHFLSILSDVSDPFPNFLWDQLLPQTELTLNLHLQSTLASDMSA